MSNAAFNNVAVLIGEITNASFNAEVGKKGIANIGLNCGGDSVRVNIWGKGDGSVKNFVNELEEGKVYQVQGSLSQDKREEQTYINVTAWGTQGFTPKPDDEEQKAVASIKGDVHGFDLKFTPEGDPTGELGLLVFNTRKDKTRAEVLQEEVKRYAEWLEKETEKDTSQFKKLYKELEDEEITVDRIHDIYEELCANTEMRFFNITHISMEFNEEVGEWLVANEVNECDNIGLGTAIVNRMEQDFYGEITGSTKKIIAQKPYEVYEANSGEVDLDFDESDSWAS